MFFLKCLFYLCFWFPPLQVLRCVFFKSTDLDKERQWFGQCADHNLFQSFQGNAAWHFLLQFCYLLIILIGNHILKCKLILFFISLTLKAFVDKGQVETKMLSALLSGVNRAFHYVQGRACSELVKTILNVVILITSSNGFGFNTCLPEARKCSLLLRIFSIGHG